MVGNYPPRVALALQTLTNKRSTSGVGISTPYGVVSTQRTTVFVPGLMELSMCSKGGYLIQ